MKDIMEMWVQLKESPKYDPEDDISSFIPQSYAVYVWFNKKDDSVEYVGKATGKRGLYQRIIKQHLNDSYLLTDKKKWHPGKDAYQIKNHSTLNGKPAIDKSAFRKNISRCNKLSAGDESMNFIKRNFYLRFLIFNDKKEALNAERRLREQFQPKYNIL